MPEGDEPTIEARVSALETEVRELKGRVTRSEQDAAAARVLAGGADRDVTEMRTEIREFRQATTASFNAMREDFTDLRADFTDLRAEMRAGHRQIVELLDTLISREGGPDTAR
jgi:hypothetical protein